MIHIGHAKSISIADCIAVARSHAPVAVSAETLDLLAERRRQIVRAVHNQKQPAYGFNRGFGHNASIAVPESELAQLQRNLIRSHASGMGPLAPEAVVRLAIMLRAHSLSQGHSGVRADVVSRLVELINAGIVPEVPLYGSVGASGDLAPLSHIGLALMGEGNVFWKGKMQPAMEALKQAGIEPLILEMKEGLALNNGLQFSTAAAVLALNDCRLLLKTAVLNTALACQVFQGLDDPFTEELHSLRPHPGAQQVARWIWELIQDSPLRLHGRNRERVQDPYSLRCSAQVLGASYDLIEEAAKTFEIEINSVTDNPLLLRSDGAANQYTRIISGGHFHGMPIAVKTYNLMQAACIIAQLSNTRCARFVDEWRNFGLGNDLIWPGLSEAERASSSGMMVAEYASAAVTNALWGAAMPSHLFSIPTDAGQEDHVSMSATLATRVHHVLPRLADALALELAFCYQAAEVRKKQVGTSLRMNPHCEAALQKVCRVFPVVTHDRSLSSELRALADQIMRGEFAELNF